MLLNYTANVTEKDGIWTGFIYSLPVRYSAEGLHAALEGLNDGLDAYLRVMLKKKAAFPLPYKQPMIAGDYDIPVQLDLAFVLILRIYRAKLPQKELAKLLGKSAAYLSSVETLDMGVTLANANEMLRKLGIKAAFTMLPYRECESESFQYSPDKEKIPMVAGNNNLDIMRIATYERPENKDFVLPFPVEIRRISGELFEASFPALEKYGLNITVVDQTAEQTIKRAENVINLTLLGTDNKLEYPKSIHHGAEVGLWVEVADKHFPEKFKHFTQFDMYHFRKDMPIPEWWITESKK